LRSANAIAANKNRDTIMLRVCLFELRAPHQLVTQLHYPTRHHGYHWDLQWQAAQGLGELIRTDLDF
jgi:hypothetical protein